MAIDFINIKIIDRFENDRTMQVEQTQIGAPKLVYNGADDKYAPIMATEFIFNLTVTDKADGKFFHLYTGNEKRYYVLVEDQDENMIFEGYLLPDFYEEPFTNGVIFVNLTATDGIGLLKGHYLPNEYYYKETSVIKLIAECLKKTKLEKTINFAPAIKSAATDYRWDEIAVNGRAYLDSDEPIRRTGLFFTVEIMPSRKTAYDILELLLKSLGCTLYAQGNQWYIEGINRKHETVQQNQIFTKEGVYVETINLDKEIKPITFFATPNISIVSPWKIVNVSWDIDEDGDLVPEYAYKFPVNPLFGIQEEGPYDFWNGVGEIGSLEAGNNFAVDGSFWDGTLAPKLPKYFGVYKHKYDGNGYSWGENIVDLNSNYYEIKNNKRKYLKISDEYIERKLTVDIDIIGGNPFSEIVYNYDSDNEVEEILKDFFKISVRINNTLFLSTKNYLETPNVLHYFKIEPNSSILDIGSGNPTYLVSRHKVTLKLDFLRIPNNGFFNMNLHAVVNLDYTNPYFRGYLFNKISCKYTEEKTFEDVLERDIDFTAVYDLDIFHGDSIQDLSEKQWRFRRPIFETEGGFGQVQILGSVILFPNQPWIYHYYISQSTYNAILQNPELFYVTYLGQDIAMNDLTNGILKAWSLIAEFGGAFRIQIDSQLITHPSGIGSSITDFSNLFVDETEPFVIGYEFEDNEWRESWKRFGEDEDIRYCVALAKIYHDVQNEAHVKIEGTATDLFFPRDLASFYWIEERDFIFSRVEIDFSRGRTNVLLLEATHQIVDDYVNR